MCANWRNSGCILSALTGTLFRISSTTVKWQQSIQFHRINSWQWMNMKSDRSKWMQKCRCFFPRLLVFFKPHPALCSNVCLFFLPLELIVSRRETIDLIIMNLCKGMLFCIQDQSTWWMKTRRETRGQRQQHLKVWETINNQSNLNINKYKPLLTWMVFMVFSW